MPSQIKQTNDSSLKSWVESANDITSDFPIQNLPFCIFSTAQNKTKRIGIAIGEYILDLYNLKKTGSLKVLNEIDYDVLSNPYLNDFIALGRQIWQNLRIELSTILRHDNAILRDNHALHLQVLVLQKNATLFLPVKIGGYTDFYSSKEHATNCGALFRDPKNALLPNWLELPIAYNGRASSIIVSGNKIKRPNGQIKTKENERPIFAPCKKLDFELEMGYIIGQNSELGTPIKCENAQEYVFGMVLVNDWSARDIQQFEYVPLGPFNAKTFATTISPYVVTMDALEPFKCTSPMQNPKPLKYLRHNLQKDDSQNNKENKHSFDIKLEVDLRLANESEAITISSTNFKYMYWSIAQQIAHHTISGCNLNIGDLLASGTISGNALHECGSLLEMTYNGTKPLIINNKEYTFIEDGDEIIMRGFAQGSGYKIGFGKCSGMILPANKIDI